MIVSTLLRCTIVELDYWNRKDLIMWSYTILAIGSHQCKGHRLTPLCSCELRHSIVSHRTDSLWKGGKLTCAKGGDR